MKDTELVVRSTTEDRVVVRLREVSTALQSVRTIEQAKLLVDVAAAQKVFAQRQHLSQDVIGYAHEIKTHSLARLGELLKVMPKAGGTRSNFRGRDTSGGAKRIPPENTTQTYRDLGLSKKTAAVAQQLAAMPEPTRDAIAKQEISISTVMNEQRRTDRMVKLADVARGNTPLRADTRYPIIYADPPWRYEHVETESRAIENQYPTMTIEDICAVPISNIVTPDCVLFLWATSPKLAEAIRVVGAWGFSYRTSMVWVKDQIGMGYYARQQHELLLIGVRGAPPVPAPADRPASVIQAPRTKHSAKPHAFYEAIERMYPLLPKIELFARHEREGWASWGNQAA